MLKALQTKIFLIILDATKLSIMLQEDNRVNYPITRREQDIIEYLSHSMTEKEIGEKLFISPKTVNNHLDNIRKKIGVSKNIEIIAFHIATLRGKKFDLNLLREYGISVFILFLNVCRIDL